MLYNEIGKTGMRVSALSFGASSLGGVFHGIREEEGIRAVHVAVDNGINFIDVSPYYGHLKAEQVLGKALREIPRDKYYLSTKVGRYGKDGVNMWDYSAERVTRSVYESMERLGIDYIDLINVHDIEFQAALPGGLQKVADETLPALVKLRDEGVVRHVGITDLQPENLQWVIDHVEPGTVESSVFDAIRQQEALRAQYAVFDDAADTWALETHNEHVLGIGRYYRREKLLALFNFSDEPQIAWLQDLSLYTDLITGAQRDAGAVQLPAGGFLWLYQNMDRRTL